MRYLTRQFAIGAIRRGNEVEQFLGGDTIDGSPVIRWVTISPGRDGIEVAVNTRLDLDDDRFGDLPNLPPPPSGPEESRLGRTDDPEQALLIAERHPAVSPDRWVNVAVAGDDYRDFVRSRRI